MNLRVAAHKDQRALVHPRLHITIIIERRKGKVVYHVNTFYAFTPLSLHALDYVANTGIFI